MLTQSLSVNKLVIEGLESSPINYIQALLKAPHL